MVNDGAVWAAHAVCPTTSVGPAGRISIPWTTVGSSAQLFVAHPSYAGSRRTFDGLRPLKRSERAAWRNAPVPAFALAHTSPIGPVGSTARTAIASRSRHPSTTSHCLALLTVAAPSVFRLARNWTTFITIAPCITHASPKRPDSSAAPRSRASAAATLRAGRDTAGVDNVVARSWYGGTERRSHQLLGDLDSRHRRSW